MDCPDGTADRKNIENMTNGDTAKELEKVIHDTHYLIAECLEILNAKAASLIKDIRAGRLTKAETEARHAEIPDLRNRMEHVKNQALDTEKKA